MRDENAMAASQAGLNEANAEILLIVKQYTSGMISITEFVSEISFHANRVGNINLSGLTDPNTGLQYPTEAETAAFMSRFADIVVEIKNGNS